MRRLFVVLSFSLIAFAGCNNGNTSGTAGAANAANTTSAAVAAPVKSNLSDAGTSLLMVVVAKYYGLKNALVATKAANAGIAAADLAALSDSMQAFLSKDTTAPPSLKTYIDTIAGQSRFISTLKDETCEKQRLAFGTISSAIYGMLKAAGLRNGRVYREYCPMAFNEKGAYWLSDESEIKNPYFGKKMMECGEVTDSL